MESCKGSLTPTVSVGKTGCCQGGEGLMNNMEALVELSCVYMYIGYMVYRPCFLAMTQTRHHGIYDSSEVTGRKKAFKKAKCD